MTKLIYLRGLFVINLLLITLVNNAQNPLTNTIEDIMEDISVNNYDEENIDWSNTIEELYQQIEQPLNLNIAVKEDLMKFPFLSPIQIENILAYIYIHGEMKTTSELMLIEDLDKKTIDYLKPFVCSKPVDKSTNINLKQLLKTNRNELITRFYIPLYRRKGYEDKYLGPPVYHSLRYSLSFSNRIYFGLVGEKDAGEPFGALYNKKGYDFYSYYLLIQNIGRLKTLAVGNYQMSFGQGLVMNSGFSMGKTSSLSTTFNTRPGIRKHSSTDEYNYFRGVASTITISKQIDVSAFYSNRSVEGEVNEQGELTSIYKSGLHRTDKESLKRDAATMQLIGGNVQGRFNQLQLGVTGIYYFMNRSYQPNLTGYRKHNIHGDKFYNVGLDYAWRYQHFFLSGEVAKGTSGLAAINQLHYEFSQNYRLMLVHRYYAHDYWAMYANSFSESSGVQNENGWYIAGEFSPFKYWNFFASVDFFSFPWWKYRISKSSQGIDTNIRASFNPNQPINMDFSYRFKKKERDISGTQGEQIYPTYQHRWRYRLNYLPNGLLTMRTTVDFNLFGFESNGWSNGYHLTQSVSYKLPWFPLNLQVQASYFNTDDYDSRVYINERQMLYAFYTPAFQGEGFRWMAYVRYDLNRHWMAMIKMGQTIYRDRKTIGSGSDLIASNRKADVQMLLRVKF